LTILLTTVSFTSLKAEGIADVYFYKARPGGIEEAANLMREGRDVGLSNGQSIIVHQQNIGRGGEKIFVWIDFFEDYNQRAKQPYSSDSWAPFIEKFNSQDILEPIKSYQMTSLDEIDPGDYIVQVWTWDPKQGKSEETLEALQDAKEIIEKHGFLVDLWQHGLGSQNFFQFVMLSTSKEAQGKSYESLLADEDWQKKQQDWFDKKKYGRLVESYEMTSLN
jgi:hypothetical protein|tara:strand:- start:587 stop:1249 length:663 start_codon:yes stop_codon:yes gene_type:complete